MIYRLDSFEETSINPVTGTSYDFSWLIFILNNESYSIMCGSRNQCAYTLKVSKQYKYWKMSLGDFINWNEKENKNSILVASKEDYEAAMEEYRGHHCNDPFLRPYEPPVMVHSTTKENYNRIQKCGCLKSWNLLKKENGIQEKFPIGSLLGDPPDFSNYILFGSGITGEIVVNSKQNHQLIYQDDIPYQTGARYYFDMEKIAANGLLYRDGGTIKVKDVLPLQPYLIWISTWDKIGLQNEISTPKIFAETSDFFFRKHYRKDF